MAAGFLMNKLTCLCSVLARVPSSILNSASPLWSHLDSIFSFFEIGIGEVRNTHKLQVSTLVPPQLHRLHLLLPLLLHLCWLLPHHHWQLQLHLVLRE